MSVYIDEFQRLFVQLEWTGSNAVSEKVQGSTFFFIMGHHLSLESTIASFCTKSIKALKWTDVTSDLIAKWKSIQKQKYVGLQSIDSKPKVRKISGVAEMKIERGLF